MTNGEKLKEIFPDWICLFSQNWLKEEYKPNKSEIPTGSIIDWNNCHTSEQLEKISTTKNDLGVDAISREDAIKAMQDKAKKLTNEDTINGLCGAVAILYEMPSVTPIRPKGHWIVAKGGSYLGKRNACCSNCRDFYTLDWNVMRYCPNCGAEMRGEE